MRVMGISKFERFFRSVGGLDIDKQDLKRYNDFVNRKVYDLLVRAQAAAHANGRDVIEVYDIPITRGLRECLREFERFERELDLKPLLDEMTALPPLDLAYSTDAQASVSQIAGGLSVALARAFKVMDPALKNPHSADWETAFKVFDLLL